MEPERKTFYKIINELCYEKNIQQTKLSYGWIRELRKNNVCKHIINYQFDLNSTNSYNIAGDKFATYEVLKANNIPTIEHRMIFNPKTRSMFNKNQFIENVIKLLKESNNKVVIKANNSCKGKDVYFCSTESEIENIIKKLFNENNDSLSACPYIDIDFEYRVIYLYGEVLYVYKKKKPYVIGNGKNTVNELIDLKFPFRNEFDICRDVDLSYIPEIGEEVTISWKHNLSNGAEPILIDDNDEFMAQVKKLAINTAKSININFASVDIAVTSDKKVLVMEVNGSVCMNKFAELIPEGYEIAKMVYSKAIDKMFE